MSEDLTKSLPASDSEKLTLILTTVQSLTVRFDNMDLRFNNVDSRLAAIDSRLVHVEHTVNDMRPVLQKLTTDVSQLQEGQLQLHGDVLRLQGGQQQLQEGQLQLHGDVLRLQDGQQQLQEGQLQLHGDVLRLQDGQQQLQEGQDRLSVDVHAMRRDVSYRFLALSGATNVEIRNLKERVTRIEENLNPPKSGT